MQVAKRLYIDEEVKKPNKVIKAIKRNKKVKGYYVLYYNEDVSNPLEIIFSEELCKQYYKQQKLTLVGLAIDKEKAFTIVNDIIRDMLTKGNSFNDRSFFD